MRLALAACTLTLAPLALSACGGSGGGVATRSTPTPLSTAAMALQRYARATGAGQFAASYAAQTTGQQDATVGVYFLNAQRYRIDVRQGAVTASLFATAQGSVACGSSSGKAPLCFLAAGPGDPVPNQFDAGIQRIFTQDLPRLAADPSGLDIREAAPLAATASLAAASCFAVNAPTPATTPSVSGARTQVRGVDLGTYCLGESGLPRALTFGSGTLTLLRDLGPLKAAILVPPGKVLPLPRATATPPTTPAP